MNQSKVLNEILSRLERLEDAVFGAKLLKNVKKSSETKSQSSNTEINFNINERAFINKYAREMSGPKKFTLLVAFKTKGKESSEASLSEIEKIWNRITALLGGKFNRFYPNAAKTYGWVDSKKKGLYHITNSWREIFK